MTTAVWKDIGLKFGVLFRIQARISEYKRHIRVLNREVNSDNREYSIDDDNFDDILLHENPL
jgi:hypothetical protein